MAVIVFTPRPDDDRSSEPGLPDEAGASFTGVFRSPRGRMGTLRGHLRLQRLVITPRGAFVTGVFTGELREFDGTLVGIDSRRYTARADVQRLDAGLQPVLRPVQLDFMGITVDVRAFPVPLSLPCAPPHRRTRDGGRSRVDRTPDSGRQP